MVWILIVGLILIAGAAAGGWYVYREKVGSPTSDSSSSTLDEDPAEENTDSEEPEESADLDTPESTETSEEEAIVDPVWLVHLGKKRVYKIDSFPVRIGRHPLSAVQISSRDISRIHFWIETEKGNLVIRPLDTSNPTLVNGQQIPPEETYRIEHEDIVEIGNVGLQFSFSEPDLAGEEEDLSDKRRGAQYVARTAKAGGDEWRKKIKNLLSKHDGDFEKVGDELGMEPEGVHRMLKLLEMDEYLDH